MGSGNSKANVPSRGNPAYSLLATSNTSNGRSAPTLSTGGNSSPGTYVGTDGQVYRSDGTRTDAASGEVRYDPNPTDPAVLAAAKNRTGSLSKQGAGGVINNVRAGQLNNSLDAAKQSLLSDADAQAVATQNELLKAHNLDEIQAQRKKRLQAGGRSSYYNSTGASYSNASNQTTLLGG